MLGLVPKFSKTPGALRHMGPTVGQHNKTVYGDWLGLNETELTELSDAGSFSYVDPNPRGGHSKPRQDAGIRELLADYPGHIISLDDAGVPDEVEETGDTFQANAILKASTYAQLSGPTHHLRRLRPRGPCLGRCARRLFRPIWWRCCQTDQDRVALLLRNLAEIPRERRIARFRCFTAVADPSDGAEPRVSTVVGSIAGVIQYEPVGEHGFGYDPVFYLPSFRATMAQLPVQAKNAISHRADAARRARLILAAL